MHSEAEALFILNRMGLEAPEGEDIVEFLYEVNPAAKPAPPPEPEAEPEEAPKPKKRAKRKKAAE